MQIKYKIDKLLTTISLFVVKHAYLNLLILSIIILISIFFTLKIKLVSDFQTMLPSDFQSVKDLKKYTQRVGGLEYLSIGLKSSDPEALKRFAEDLVPELRKKIGKSIASIDYNVKMIQDFYHKNALLFIDEKDLSDAHEKIKQYVSRKKMEETGLYVDLDDTDENSEDSLKQIEKRLDDAQSSYVKQYNYPDGYYLKINPRGKSLLVLLVKPKAFSTNIVGNKQFIKNVKSVIESLNPESYSSDFSYGFAGPVQIAIDEYEAIKKDILSTAGLCVALIALSIFLYFLRFRMVILLGSSLVAGMSWTLALTYGTIGYLNTQTGFLASIIMGTSINYGIIWLARYLEEREKNDIYESVKTASLKTWQATLAACLTTAVSFAVLMLSKNKSFIQFGFIASTGLIFNWIAHIVFMPSVAVIIEKFLPITFKNVKGLTYNRAIGWIGNYILKFPVFIILITFLIFGYSGWKIYQYIPNSLEYNLNNLRNKMTFRSGTAVLDEQISDIISRSTATATILTNSIDQALQLCKVLEKKVKTNPRKYGYQSCRTINSFLPEDQDKKLDHIVKMRKIIDNHWALFPEEYKNKINKIKNLLLIERPLKISDFPDQMLQLYKENDGSIGKMAYVSPVRRKDIWIYNNLKRFVETIKENRLPDGTIITASGGPVIMYDLLKLIIHDAPRDTIFAMIGVFIFIWIIFKNVRSSLVITTSLLIGVTILGGIMALLDIKINFFNYIAIPTAFGTSADYGINILHRYRLERENKLPILESLRIALGNTGGAVFLCSLTTVIGYAVLMYSNSQALVLYGWIAIIGELTCLTMAIFFIPAFISIFKNWFSYDK